MEKLANDIVRWLTAYVREAGLNGYIVGVSGGIDSAVVSTLCAKSGLPTYVLNIPINSSPENTELSNLQCRWFGDNFDNVEKLVFDLTPVLQELEGVLDCNQETAHTQLARANSKSRLRMVALYHVATIKEGLVVGTGNKVEDFGVGFFTKYGDGGVDISPIADLTKTEVRALGEHLGVPSSVLRAPPTDGLWEDSRSDEDQLGASYEELEWAMKVTASPEPPRALSKREEEILRIYEGFHKRNKHKMLPIPVYKVTS